MSRARTKRPVDYTDPERESRACQGCGHVFWRREEQCDAEFNRRRYCHRACAAAHAVRKNGRFGEGDEGCPCGLQGPVNEKGLCAVCEVEGLEYTPPADDEAEEWDGETKYSKRTRKRLGITTAPAHAPGYTDMWWAAWGLSDDKLDTYEHETRQKPLRSWLEDVMDWMQPAEPEQEAAAA